MDVTEYSVKLFARSVIVGKNIKTSLKGELSMKPETAGKIKYGAWGLIGGAVISMIIGFGWGGWTTASTSQQKTADAVLTSQGAICVAQFMKAPDHAVKLKEFGSVDYWKRDDFIEKGGWHLLPGQETAVDGIARVCADGLALLVSK